MHLTKKLLSTVIGTAFLVTQFITPVIAADTAQGSSQHDHGHKCEHKMSSVDSNKDGKISKEEFMKHHEAMFEKNDANKDGFLDETERRDMMKNMHKHMHGYSKQPSNTDHAHENAKD
ncbi:calcium-binding protein [Nitrosomonas supralitoralis]|uniref:Calcium-binding protein n=1 Tax=Nitrosomonas supralitoralis TaxID=2116706 RepID=A0A2P7NUT3_9PROT|nr:calcium-binding protein [Nitrosomonas supralitoralis]PSJ17230.1 calcium-binding protein [Nitrosomonas supralitoralis]